MPLRWKVVKRKTRNSAVINGNSKYALKYLPGEVVTALSDTVGVMTFTTRRAAEEWAQSIEYHNYSMNTDYEENLIVIEVEGIGQGFLPMYISRGAASNDLKKFYGPDYASDASHMSPLDKTMCYRQVRVLE